uniref:Uncharacterized protein n=1 Tax=Rhizophora mucronata TaxID=61149 RepID=A0A2P2QHD1_RHIMU
MTIEFHARKVHITVEKS